MEGERGRGRGRGRGKGRGRGSWRGRDKLLFGVCVCSVIMETDPAVLTQRIAIKVDDTEQSVRNVRI